MINLHIPVHVFDEVKPPSSLKSIHLITKIFFIYIYSVYIQLMFSVYFLYILRFQLVNLIISYDFFPLKHFIHVICTVDLLYILHCQLI